MTPPPHTLVLFVSGLGGNQFKVKDKEGLSLIERAEALPGVKVVRIDDPGYFLGRTVNITERIAKERAACPSIVRVIVVQHSGSWYAAAAACEAGAVDFLIAVDPAWWDFDTLRWPHPDGKRQEGAFFKAILNTPGILQLNITDGPEIELIVADHNTITRSPEVRGSVLTLLDGSPVPA